MKIRPYEGRAYLEGRGVVFGEPVGDGLFQAVTLPEGWEKKGSDHALWSYIYDKNGEEVCSIFFKSTPWDTDAFMNVNVPEEQEQA